MHRYASVQRPHFTHERASPRKPRYEVAVPDQFDLLTAEAGTRAQAPAGVASWASRPPRIAGDVVAGRGDQPPCRRRLNSAAVDTFVIAGDIAMQSRYPPVPGHVFIPPEEEARKATKINDQLAVMAAWLLQHPALLNCIAGWGPHPRSPVALGGDRLGREGRCLVRGGYCGRRNGGSADLAYLDSGQAAEPRVAARPVHRLDGHHCCGFRHPDDDRPAGGTVGVA